MLFGLAMAGKFRCVLKHIAEFRQAAEENAGARRGFDGLDQGRK